MKRALALGLAAAACGGVATPPGERRIPVLLPYDGGSAWDEVRSRDAGAVADAGPRPPFENEGFEVPARDGGLHGMSCGWLDAPDNCWKAAMASVLRCLGDAGVGRLADTRCAFGNGAAWQSSSPPAFGTADGGERGWTTAVRLEGPSGATCLETAHGFAKARFITPAGTLHLSNTSLFDYELRCTDGTTFSNQADAGACDSFGLRFLFGGVPGFDAQCSDTACWLRATGTTSGVTRRATCAL